ncbi:MAG TPA: ScpA family protein [Rhodopila sp.]|uniref:segregation and condensation protein A n=1 Tax=Rhodopila sp. TaxID=2480087 RepID=UPI002B87704D|nr:ScpA family protein [Rhodopila sp.]HVY15228.1 ScpA family protein [Rhodopila sp.]
MEPALDTAHSAADTLILHLDGFEGPMDLLLNLARAQKVDLAKISILSLVDQYLAVIADARKYSLELTADWLLMAAWLTWLKSRLLLPAPSDELEDAEAVAAALTERLAELSAMRKLSAWLGRRPILGDDVFARGMPESHEEIDSSGVVIEPGVFIRAYLRAMRRGAKSTGYTPKPLNFWTLQAALHSMSQRAERQFSWTDLQDFLPESPFNETERRAAVASTFLAGLELAKSGAVQVRQQEAFGPILLRTTPDGSDPAP